MAKVQLKSETINPFGGLFSIFRQFDLSGMRSAIDKHLGKRGKTKAAYSYADVFSSLFASYFCGGDVVEDVMDVKPFWNHRDGGFISNSFEPTATAASTFDYNPAPVKPTGAAQACASPRKVGKKRLANCQSVPQPRWNVENIYST